MAKALVIVESPAKAKTINKFLGRDFTVKASMGHVRDLPKRTLGVEEEDFEPEYAVLPDKKKTLSDLKKAAKGCEAVYLAADPDREGEAICWHLQEELSKGTDADFHRVLFNEITKKAILAAFETPAAIDMHKVEAQQTRRILDRLVGYKISPLLWDKVRRGLSAGRVQSVALRIICRREREIREFRRREYWSLAARLAGKNPPEFNAKLVLCEGKKVEPVDSAETATVLEELGYKLVTEPGEGEGALIASAEGVEPAEFKVASIQAREKKKNPFPPFITSKLQQDAARQLGFTVKKTMRVAQGLYEGREIGDAGTVGLITYMRTDSPRISDDAIAAARDYIAEAYGKDSLPEKPRVYKVAKQAQEAHEAIRPTSTEFAPERVEAHLGRDEFRLYSLIWNRFIASQMASAVFDVTRIDIDAGRYTFRANGQVLKFSGWLAVYNVGKAEDPRDREDDDTESDDKSLPQLTEGEVLDPEALLPKQHFTQPPPRFSEATLVKELEENGIGRPSTYATILATIMNKDYVVKENRRFSPTELGLLVNELVVTSFDDIINNGYTAQMEQKLDRIEEGQLAWKDALAEFKVKFDKDLERAAKEMRDVKREAIPTDQDCDKCGKTMVLKWGRFGQFLACSGYPDCKNTRDLAEDAEIESDDSSDLESAAKTAKVKAAPSQVEVEAEPCEKCGEAMVLRRGRYGPFLACSSYPDCKNTRKVTTGKDGKAEAKADVLLDEECPKCSSKLSVKQGRFGEFTACSSYPKCRFVKMKETGVACPECSAGNVVERRSKRGKLFFGCSEFPDCNFVTWKKPVGKKCPDCNASYLVERITKKTGHQFICDSENCGYSEDAPPE
jgi:DNA topoisomerase-1